MTITEAAQSKVDQVINGEGFLGIYLGRWRVFRLQNKAIAHWRHYQRMRQMISDYYLL